MRDLPTGAGLSGGCRLNPLNEVPATFSRDKLVVDKAVLDQWTPQPQHRPFGYDCIHAASFVSLASAAIAPRVFGIFDYGLA